jgi:hypothetical protein
MREPLELDDVLRTAVDEIQQALGLERVVVRMATGKIDDGLG